MEAEHLPEDDTTLANYHLDRKILDSLIVIAGFGLCRSWIVFCLAAPFGQTLFYATSWVYLIIGALTALMVAIAVRFFKNRVNHMRQYLFLATGISVVLSALMIPFSIMQELEPLLFSGFILGGIGAGMLQVLWGERFTVYKIQFATIVSPSAAIVTALLVSFAFFGLNLIGYVIYPLLSFALLVVITTRTGISLSSLFNVFSRKKEGDTSLLQEMSEERKQPGDESKTQTREATRAQGDDAKIQTVEGAQIKQADATQKTTGIKRNPYRSNVRKLMISIMVFTALCRIFDAVLTSGPDPFDFFGGSALVSLVFVGGAFLIFAALLKDRFNPTFTYRLSLPIMVAGFVAIALFFDTHAALSILLINIGYEFFDILSWILFTEISRREGEQPFRIFGYGVAFMFIGMVVGLICGEMFSMLILSGEVQITVIAMLSILSLVVVAFLVIPEGTVQHLTQAINADKKESEKVEEPEPVVAWKHEESCAIIAEEYHLTPRESEVLVLLAYGRTFSVIARELHIAKGTARTHIENIYRKLDVHKQQELIDLVEDCQPRS